jgi:cyclic pyranopterin phosphate synthase
MPLDADHTWSRHALVTADEILEVVGASYDLRPRGHNGHAPAEEFDVVDGPGRARWATTPGRLGVIASVTRPFCRDCDRLRLTADGQLRTCLFAQSETDLRGPLRSGASDDDLAQLIRQAVEGKQAGHGIDQLGFVQPTRTMSAIGG